MYREEVWCWNIDRPAVDYWEQSDQHSSYKNIGDFLTNVRKLLKKDSTLCRTEYLSII
jgi:DNA-binding SARP family transcriptional activator